MNLIALYRFADKLIPEQVSHDRDWLPIYPRLFVILTAGLTISVLAFNGIMLLTAGTWSAQQSWLMLISVFVELIPLLVFYFSGKFQTATGLLLLGNFFLLAIYVLVSAGFDSPALTLLPTIPFMAVVFGQNRHALAWAITVSLFALAMYGLKQTGLVLPDVLASENKDAARLFNWFLLTWSIFLGFSVFSFVNHDHAQHAHEQRNRLHQSIITDDLTGLLNRKGLENLLKEQDSRNQHRSGTLFVFDLDTYNEAVLQLGTAHAERLLRDIGQHMRRSLPSEYHVARIEEDCFAVYRRHAGTPEDCRRIAKRIAHRMARTVQNGSAPLHLTASHAFCSVPGDVDSHANLLPRAIERLKSSRRSKANQIA